MTIERLRASPREEGAEHSNREGIQQWRIQTPPETEDESKEKKDARSSFGEECVGHRKEKKGKQQYPLLVEAVEEATPEETDRNHGAGGNGKEDTRLSYALSLGILLQKEENWCVGEKYKEIGDEKNRYPRMSETLSNTPQNPLLNRGHSGSGRIVTPAKKEGKYGGGQHENGRGRQDINELGRT